MRFNTEMGDSPGRWLVVDTADEGAIVGAHTSATLAALDAFKREQESLQEDPLAQVRHKTAA